MIGRRPTEICDFEIPMCDVGGTMAAISHRDGSGNLEAKENGGRGASGGCVRGISGLECNQMGGWVGIPDWASGK